jgi:hypothetical protein
MVFVCAKLGLDTEDSFVTLEVTGGATTFPCNQTDTNSEYIEVSIPENFSCESCTLQFIWKGNGETQYHCADVLIDGESLNNCWKLCKNEGSCFNGECICPKGYGGEFCESKGVVSSNCYSY